MNVKEVELTDNGIEALSHSTSLTQLNLTGTKITDAGLKHLENLKNLKKLILLDCPKLTLAAMQQFKKNRPNCGVYVVAPTGSF